MKAWFQYFVFEQDTLAAWCMKKTQIIEDVLHAGNVTQA